MFERNKLLFFFNFEDISLFVGPSGCDCLGCLGQGGSPRLCASLPVCNRTVRFTSDAPPAGLLAASMAAVLFRSTYLRTSIGGARVRDLALKEISLYLQVEASFDSDEAKKCLGWMKAVGVDDADESQCSHDAFYTHLRDGNILCK